MSRHRSCTAILAALMLIGACRPADDARDSDPDGSAADRAELVTRVTNAYPAFSPDGAWIACRRIMTDGNWEVVVMDADGGNAHVVAPHEAADGWPAWSPDGTRLAFASERAGSSDLYVLDLESGALRRVTHDDTRDDRQPWWSPDGRVLAFSRYVWFRDQPFYEASEIYLIGAD